MIKKIKYAKFDGDGYMQIEVKDSDILHELTNSDLTFSVICKPNFVKPIDLNAPDWREHYEDFALVVRTGLHLGIFYTTVNAFTAKAWDDTNIEYPIHTLQPKEDIIHLTFSINYNKKRLKFYANGILVSTTTLPKDKNFYKYPETFSDYYIGCANPNSEEFNCFYSGKIYEVSMWKSELGAKEIKTLSDNKFNMDLLSDIKEYQSSNNLVGHWNFDIVSVNKVFDESLSDHVGILSDNVEIETEEI